MENKRSKTRELTPEELRTETAVTDVRHREFIQLAEQGDVACVQTQAKSAQLIPRLDQKKWLPHDICSDTTKKQIEDWLEE